MGPDQNQNKRLIEVGTVSWRRGDANRDQWSTGGRRRHGGRGHHGFSRRTRVTQWLGKGHWVHGRELWRRLGTSVGQFRQWNVARSHGKRELRRCLERAATIISHLPPRGLVQTRTATSRYGIFLSGGGPQAGPARVPANAMIVGNLTGPLHGYIGRRSCRRTQLDDRKGYKMHAIAPFYAQQHRPPR
jgi:hypothetical protein